MASRALVPAAFLALLAACGDARGSGARAGRALDFALAARVVVGADELWLVQVRESEQGGRDGNGDGDALDELVYVLDLARGSGPAALVASGLALASAAGAPLVACDGQAAAVAVDEAAQGATDLNGDGDALDRVLFVYRRELGRFEGLGLAVRALTVGGTLVACAVDEHDQDARDLDADGDATDSIVAVHDLADGSTTTLALRDSTPLAIADGKVALRLAERAGLDLTLDGDDQTTPSSSSTTAYGDSSEHDPGARERRCRRADGTFGVSVSERGQGRDLSGDGDPDDAVFHVYDPARGYSLDLGLFVPLHPPPVVDGQRHFAARARAAGAHDVNGDGDREDLVVASGSPPRAAPRHRARDGGPADLIGDWLGVSVPESMQGARDLDGDGAADGNVVHVIELATGRIENLDLDAFVLHGTDERVFLAPYEGLARVDWNGDGDQDDRILFDWNATDGRARGRRGRGRGGGRPR